MASFWRDLPINEEGRYQHDDKERPQHDDDDSVLREGLWIKKGDNSLYVIFLVLFVLRNIV